MILEGSDPSRCVAVMVKQLYNFGSEFKFSRLCIQTYFIACIVIIHSIHQVNFCLIYLNIYVETALY